MSTHTPGPRTFTMPDGHVVHICDACKGGNGVTLCPLHAAAPRMLERIRRDVEQCGCNSLPVRPLKMPDGSIQVGCGYCREKRAILRDVEGESNG